MRHSPKSRGFTARVKSATMALIMGVTAATLVACGEQQESASDLLHDADQPTRGTESWMWQSAPENEFRKIMGQLLDVSVDNYLPSDHALVKRTQLWVDRLDAQLRAAHPEALANVPSPKAQVIKDPTTNAFVAPVPVCYHVGVKLAAGAATQGTTAEAVYLDLGKGGLSSWPSELDCIAGANDVATLKSVVAKFNTTSIQCKLAMSGDTLVPGEGCERDADIQGIVAAKNVVFFHTASFITVHTGLFPSMTEEAFVSVLAHELGHYYRAHTSSSETEYDFFYTMGQNSPAHRPTPDASLRTLGENAMASSMLLNATETFRAVPGAVLRPELFFSAGSIILGACNAGDCSQACATARDYMTGSEFGAAIGTFPFGRAASNEAEVYAAFESKALACLADMTMVSTPNTLTGTKVSADKITALVEAPTWPSWLQDVSPSAQRQIQKFTGLAAARLSGNEIDGANAAAAFLSGVDVLNEQDAQSIDVLKAAQARRLGQYTIEQEADDEAAEWIAETGLDPKHVVEAMRSLGRGTETAMGGMMLGEADCDALWANKWRDANGSYVFVPIGDYSEIHHSVCYRMFNLEREIAAHEHQRANVQAPLLTAARWRALQSQADGLAESATEANRPRAVHRLIEQTNAMSCLYSYEYH